MSSEFSHKCACVDCICSLRTREEDMICKECKKGSHDNLRGGKRY